MNEQTYEEMFRVESHHWWFEAKHRIVCHLLKKYAPSSQQEDPRLLIDLGCGCGHLLTLLQKNYDAFGMDASPQAISFSQQRHIRVHAGSLPHDLPFKKASADIILLLDVLEHIEDDHASFARAVELLKPGGLAICTVPAYPWLWTQRDEHHQHFRRYTYSQFQSLMNSAGMCSTFTSHMNTLLFPIAVMERLTRKLFPLKDGQGDLQIPPRPINFLLRESFAAERRLLGHINLPFGLSLVSLTRKPM